MDRSIVFEKSIIHFWENDYSIFLGKMGKSGVFGGVELVRMAKKSVGKLLPTLDLGRFTPPNRHLRNRNFLLRCWSFHHCRRSLGCHR